MLNIRVLKKDEFPSLFKHSYDAKLEVEELHLRCQHKVHPNDFFIAHKDKSIVGYIVAIRQSDELGFISTFLVLKEFRAKGYGTLILDFALEHLRDRQVVLDSILENTHIYTKAGFQSYFDLHTFLYITKKHRTYAKNIKFINYDECNSQNKQNKYLKCLLSNKDTNYKAIQTNNITKSYGISFKHNDGYKIVIGSSDYEESKAIFEELTKEFDEGISIYIEATKLNPIFLNLADELGMIEYARFARMYNKVL